MTLLNKRKILYVDNDPTSAGAVRVWLTQHAPGCKVICVDNGQDALKHIEGGDFDLYLFEYCHN